MYKEIIVVEGTHDKQKLESIYPGIECIITNGSSVSEETISAIRLAQESRGVILFLDPDFPGKKITNFILERISGLKIAFLSKKDAISKNKKKVGIEHASPEAVKRALEGVFTVQSDVFLPITREDLSHLQLFGESNSQAKRQALCEHLGIPLCNGKALIHWINRLHITKNQIEEALL